MSAAERRWLGRATALLSLLALLPYLVAELAPPAGTAFVGTFWSTFDLAQYLSAMHQGAASSSWLIFNTLSPEPHQPALIYPSYVALGKLAGLLGAQPRTALLAAEVVARVVLAGVVYWFAGRFLPRPAQRRAAWLLTFTGAGLGPLLAGLAEPLERLGASPGVTYVELNGFILLLTSPHLMLSLALTLASTGLVLAGGRASWHQVGLLFGLQLGLGLTNPFCLVVVLVAPVARLAATRLCGGTGRADLARAAAVAAGAAPFLAYYGLIFGQDPFWGEVYGRQNLLPSPGPLALLLGFGPPLGLAAAGLPGWWRRSNEDGRALVGWTLALLLLAYAPLPFQRRLLFGLQPALAVLSAPLVLSWLRGIPARTGRAPATCPASLPLRLAGGWLLAGSACLSYLALLIPAPAGSPEAAPPQFQPREGFALAEWLEREVDRPVVVLASPWDGNLVASQGQARALIAHHIATLDPAGKRAVLAELLRPETSSEARARLLARFDVAFLLDSPRLRALGDAPAESLADLTLVAQSGDYRLFAVRAPR